MPCPRDLSVSQQAMEAGVFPGVCMGFSTPAGEATWWLADLGRDGGAWVDRHTG